MQIPASLTHIGISEDQKLGWTVFQGQFQQGFTLPPTVTDIYAEAFLYSTLPLGFEIPANVKIYSSSASPSKGGPSLKQTFFYELGASTPQTALSGFKMPPDTKWSSPNGAVAGSKIIATAATS